MCEIKFGIFPGEIAGFLLEVLSVWNMIWDNCYK